MNQIGKAVVDLAFDMGWAEGDRNYWYGLGDNDPAIEDLRAAIRKGAVTTRKKINQGGGLTQGQADSRYVRKGETVRIKGFQDDG